ncbi:septation protein SepH [Cellulomonas bogoriensis]|uniref:DNA-binding protein n=1 Tax=Cellulomonas bogoriensis 69B4 = DSM 16987 TaxID=1386082 RepID=A0A0A0C0Y4_9CELL|nr:septation protein SepH [Cellulomonas bogoriensis]KGM14278.1 DNA-binding protein [Cellulomonas bogoriensis 69B4 = DSM 16987]
MSELTLIGLHEDGEHVVLQTRDGQKLRLPIDEALRAAVRRDRPQLEQVRAERAASLPPREIQARVRAGASAEEVAEESGTAVELIRRYTGPVLAEREYVAGQAQQTRIGHDLGAPLLGELVTDRLATRGVEPGSIRWDARRPGPGSWTVEVSFSVQGTQRSASWTYDPTAKTVRAEDDEARWLSETELVDGPIPRRHLAAVPMGDADVDAALRPLLAQIDPAPAVPEDEPDPVDEAQAILDDLTDRRGVRQSLDLDDLDERFEGFGPQHAFDFDLDAPDPPVPPGPVPAAHPPASRPDQATDAQVLPMPSVPQPVSVDPPHDASTDTAPSGNAPSGNTPQARTTSHPSGGPRPEADVDDGRKEQPSQRQRQRKGRASVPSWDEIVFGARPE